MKAVPPELAAQVRSVEIDVDATLRLAAIFHRSLGRRLVADVPPAARAELEPLLPGVRKLHPALVAEVYQPSPQPPAVADLREGFAAAAQVAPVVVHSGPEVPPWLRRGVQEVLRSLGWGDEDVAEVLADLPADVARALRLSRDALRDSWSEAWAEHNGLVHQIVVVRGPVRSATLQSTYGVVYAEAAEAADPVRCFELLLHENAHHALSLREQFTTFIENPDELGSHALRPDPRPLRGVLHAAFVMWRLTRGYERYLAAYPAGGPLDGGAVGERLAFARASLAGALEVLEAAVWTPDGQALRAALATGLPVQAVGPAARTADRRPVS
jgi:HEXXH motif-containing protein